MTHTTFNKLKKGFAALLGILATGHTASATEKNWWDDAVFYQIWPRSFHDTNGDGNGDFKGITAKLDYLKDLGVDAIWLTPMFEAPSYHGYDFQEFYQVESDYGTMEDFEELLKEAEKRGMRVIADLVLNHISKENEWFKKSEKKIAPYSDYFVWSKDIKQGWKKPWGEGQPEWVWVKSPTRQEYYYAVFDGSQPDLNLKNPLVVKELEKITSFWIDKGFDGFRLDAARYLIEEGAYPKQADTESTLQFWENYRKFTRDKNKETVLIGEVWAPTDVVAKYYRNGKGLDLSFDFDLGGEILNGLGGNQKQETSFGKAGEAQKGISLAEAVSKSFERKAKSAAPVGFFSPFLSNHDQERFLMQLGNDTNKMRVAAALLLTLPGTPFLYYGEEIGMTQQKTGDDIYKRAPMLWNAGKNAGFSTADKVWVDDGKWVPWINNFSPWWHKEIEQKNLSEKSVEGQQRNPNSLLNWYKQLIALRKAHPELRSTSTASMEVLAKTGPVAAYLRKGPAGEASLVLANGDTQGKQTFKHTLLSKTALPDLISGKNMAVQNGQVALAPGQVVILKLK